jgi:hypothetical protein
LDVGLAQYGRGRNERSSSNRVDYYSPA